MNLARKGLTYLAYLVNESIYEGLLWSMVTQTVWISHSRGGIPKSVASPPTNKSLRYGVARIGPVPPAPSPSCSI